MPYPKEKRDGWKLAGLCANCGRPRVEGRSKCSTCLEVNRRASARYRPPTDESRRYHRDRRAKIRLETIEHYGGRCACCGEDEPSFLQLDHFGGGGDAHRRAVGCVGTGFIEEMRRQNWPPVLRVLCANCHFAITYRGRCPHSERTG